MPAPKTPVTPLPESGAEFLRVVRDRALSTVDVAAGQPPRGLSPAELEQRTGMSRPSVANLVRHFRPVLATQQDGASRGGRIGIDPDAGAVVGVDIGHAHVTVAVSDLAGRIHEPADPARYVRRGAAEVEDADGTLDWVTEAILHRLDELRIEPDRIAGVGIGLAGPVSPAEGLLRQGVALGASGNVRSDWELFDARDHLRRRLDWEQVPFVLDNDANLAALAEHLWGAARDSGTGDVLHVEWSEGIGAGLILGGELFRGMGVAGELGHVIVDPEGVECPCGLRGCLNAVAGWRTLHAAAPEADDLEDVLARARAGEPAAVAALREAAHHVGSALGPLVSVLNPGMVIIGGIVGSRGYDLVRAPLLQRLKSVTMRPALRDAQIVGAELEGRASLRGALALVLRPPRGDADTLLEFLERRASAARDAA